jgi:hypothetical protein
MHMKYNRKTTSYEGRHSSVDIVISYGLDGRDSLPGKRKRLFFTPHGVQTGSWAHPASYPTGTGGFFHGEGLKAEASS